VAVSDSKFFVVATDLFSNVKSSKKHS